MKILSILFSLSLSILFTSYSSAQTIIDNESIIKLNTLDVSAGPSHAGFSSTIVLDSIINTNIGEPQFGVSTKQKWEYNEALRVIERQYFRWDFNNDELYQSIQSNISYDGNTGVEITQAAFSSDDPLENVLRQNYLFGDDDIVEEEVLDTWSAYTQEWTQDEKTLLISNTASFIERRHYKWQFDIQDYEIEGKTEESIIGNMKTVTSFDVDSNGEFIPNSRRITRTQGDTPFTTLSHRQNYDEFDEVWVDQYKREVFFDSNNQTGHMLIERLLDGTYQLTDSISLSFNDFQNPAMDTTYFKHPNNGVFEITRRATYDYYPFERIMQSNFYDFNGTTSSHIGVTDYYYTEYGATAIKISVPFTVELRYPNPAQNSDQVQLISDQAAEYDFWITDQQGKIHQRSSISSNDNISLEQLNTGIYYITLFAETGQKTWKLILTE